MPRSGFSGAIIELSPRAMLHTRCFPDDGRQARRRRASSVSKRGNYLEGRAQAVSYWDTLAVLREFCGCSPAYLVPAVPSGLNAETRGGAGGARRVSQSPPTLFWWAVFGGTPGPGGGLGCFFRAAVRGGFAMCGAR